jgi:iron complex transport system ATP-binding protein
MAMSLNVRNLVCGYGGKSVTGSIDLEVEPGEVLCVLGPNGAGKSTFFKTIQGFLKPIAGEVEYNGKAIQAWDRKSLAQQIAYVPQVQSQPFPFRVKEVVVMGRAAHLGKFSAPSKYDYIKCEYIMEKLGIIGLKEKIYTKISGGERQLVLIARALAQEPQLLLMDEATSNLDFRNKVGVLQEIINMSSENIGIIMITHFPEHAFLCADKVALFRRDKSVAFGGINEIMTEQILTDAYGVNVKTPEIFGPAGESIKTCVPMMARRA